MADHSFGVSYPLGRKYRSDLGQLCQQSEIILIFYLRVIILRLPTIPCLTLPQKYPSISLLLSESGSAPTIPSQPYPQSPNNLNTALLTSNLNIIGSIPPNKLLSLLQQNFPKYFEFSLEQRLVRLDKIIIWGGASWILFYLNILSKVYGGYRRMLSLQDLLKVMVVLGSSVQEVKWGWQRFRDRVEMLAVDWRWLWFSTRIFQFIMQRWNMQSNRFPFSICGVINLKTGQINPKHPSQILPISPQTSPTPLPQTLNPTTMSSLQAGYSNNPDSSKYSLMAVILLYYKNYSDFANVLSELSQVPPGNTQLLLKDIEDLRFRRRVRGREGDEELGQRRIREEDLRRGCSFCYGFIVY